MTNELKTLAAKLAETKAELAAIGSKLAEATQRRDALVAEIQNLDAELEANELAHATAEAARLLGESSDTKATADALRSARAAMERKPDLTQQRRTADAVIVGLEQRHTEAHARYVALSDQHRAAQVKFVEARAKETMTAAHDALAQLAGAAAELAATRKVLEGLGGRWSHGSIEVNNYSPIFNPSRDAVDLMVAGLITEIGA